MDLNTTLDFFGKDTHSEFWILESRGQNKPKLAHLAHCPLAHCPPPEPFSPTRHGSRRWAWEPPPPLFLPECTGAAAAARPRSATAGARTLPPHSAAAARPHSTGARTLPYRRRSSTGATTATSFYPQHRSRRRSPTATSPPLIYPLLLGSGSELAAWTGTTTTTTTTVMATATAASTPPGTSCRSRPPAKATIRRPSPALDPATSLLPVRAWRPSTSTRRAANGRPWEGTRASFASVFKVEMSTAPMPPLPLEPIAQAEVFELEVLASVLLAALELELCPGALP